MNIFINTKEEFISDSEFVERKGVGHPDTLADSLAELLSINYSNYTLKKYGVVLHHNFDKLGLLGGSSFVSFGKGYITSPIRVLLNGRASTSFGGEPIPISTMLIDWSKDFFATHLPILDIDKDLDFHFNISDNSSPGKTYESESKKGTRKYWFEPRGISDVQDHFKPLSNDTSLGVGYAPLSSLEKVVLDVESHLNSLAFKKINRWLGSDIKILAFRNKNDYFMTICIPQIANFVKSIKNYNDNLEKTRDEIKKIFKNNNTRSLELNLNTRDNYKTSEFYLTATGSSIESGDEGLVGRGNRVNGVISPSRPMSMEGSCGKNPVYHIGKVYYILANKLAQGIYKKFKIKNEVYIASQSGRSLSDPWVISVYVPKDFKEDNELKKYLQKNVELISEITKEILENKIILF